MARQTDKQHKGVLRSLDWWTILIYLALLTFGWVSVCGASYSYGDTDIFSLDTRSGMQIVWIGTSIILGFILLMLDDSYYETFAFIIFGVMLVLLFATIFNPHSIKGSRSWLVLGPLRLQPAEFAKFATALALAKLMSIYGYDIHKWKHFATALAIIIVPMLFIVLQKETGSALVYTAFFLMLYREGMPGSILFTGVAMVVYFVVGIRYADVHMWYTPTSLGHFVVCHPLRHYLCRGGGLCGADGLPVVAVAGDAHPQLLVDYAFRLGFAGVLQCRRLCAQPYDGTPSAGANQCSSGFGGRPEGCRL